MRVLFVCTGNICRSPMAEAILNHLALQDGLQDHFDAESAGIVAFGGDGPTAQSIDVMKWRGIDMIDHRSRRLTLDMLDGADIAACMTADHRDAIESFSNEYFEKCFLLKELAEAARKCEFTTIDSLLKETSKIRSMHGEGRNRDYDIGDPYGGTLGEYDSTAQMLEVAIGDLWNAIKTTRGAPGN